MRRRALMVVAFVVPVALTLLATLPMRSSSEGACIGCGLVVILGIGVGGGLAVGVQRGELVAALWGVVGGVAGAFLSIPVAALLGVAGVLVVAAAAIAGAVVATRAAERRLR